MGRGRAIIGVLKAAFSTKAVGSILGYMPDVSCYITVTLPSNILEHTEKRGVAIERELEYGRGCIGVRMY